MNYFIVTDGHGCVRELNLLLEQWNPEKEIFVYLGDAVDRGPDSLGVVRRLMQIKRDYPESIILKGNHDAEFVAWVRSGEQAAMFYNIQQQETIASFYGERDWKRDSRKQRAYHIRRNCRQEIDFLYRLPLFHETDHCVFVHAGIDLSLDNWRMAGEGTFLWIRNAFFHSEKQIGKQIFFGHTPTKHLNEDDSFNVWISPGGDKVGLDGGCVFGGQLNAVIADERGEIIRTTSVKKQEKTVLRLYDDTEEDAI